MSNVQFYDVIYAPVVTEKATILSESSKYVFKVALDADKAYIKKAIEKIFDVKVKSVNTSITQGKKKYFKGSIGRRSDYKKAIITLEPGNTIDITVGVK